MEHRKTESFWQVIQRGMRCRCPQCGKGALFTRYLKQVDACPACGEALGHIRAEDGPAWLTIFIVGHVLVSALVFIVPRSTWPEYVSVIVWVSVALVMTLWLLPRSKGVFIGILWRLQQPRANGS